MSDVQADIQGHLEQLALQPAEPAALAAVESAYSGTGRWEELLRVYEDNAMRADKATAGTLFRKAAKVCLDELSSGPRAEAYLKRALDADATDVATLKVLRQIYLSRGDYEEGIEIYERELARCAEPLEKAAGYVEVAELYREKLQRLDKALSALKVAGKANKDNPKVHEVASNIYLVQGRLDQAQIALMKELEIGGANPGIIARLGVLAQRLLERPRLHDLAAKAADAVLQTNPADQVFLHVKAELEGFKAEWQTRVRELEMRATQLHQANPAGAADAWLTVAEIQLVYGEQSEMALVSLDRAFGIQPGHPGAMRLMEEILGSANRWTDLAMKLESMAGYARDPNLAVDLYLKAAMHHAVRLDEPDAAARLYARVLELMPGNKVASNALAEYYRERQQWDYALQVLAAWADRATNASDKVAAHYACCRILDEELNDRNRARPHYEAILALDPANQAAARALEDVYRGAKDHQALARALFAKLAGLKGDTRLPVLKELGELYAGPLAAPSHALTTLGEYYIARPSPEIREKLEELAAKAKDFTSLVAIIEGGMEKIESAGDKVQALHSLASLYEGERDAPLDALQIHRRILAIAPDEERAKEAVQRLLEVASASGDKVAFFREQLQAASSEEEKISIMHKLGQELTETAKDYGQAIGVYREILSLKPDDEKAPEAMLALYRRDNRWAEVADILIQKLEHLPAGTERVPTLMDLGNIQVQHTGQIDQAVDQYLAVLDLGADEDQTGAAFEALERLITRTKKVLAVATRLEPVYHARGDWDHAVDMGEILVREQTDPAKRVEVLKRLAKVYEGQLARPADAVAALLRAFQADPLDADLRQELERVAGVVGDFTGVIRSYRAAGQAVEGAPRRALCLRAATLAEQIQDIEGATLDFLRVMDGSDEGFTAGIDGLNRMRETGVDAGQIIAAAGRVLTMTDPDTRVVVLRRLGRYYENELQRTPEAIAAWNYVAQAIPGDEEARVELDRLYNSSAAPAELAAYLKSKLEAETEDGALAALVCKLADTMANQLGDADGAVVELAAAAAKAPGQRAIWKRLGALYRQTHKPAEAAQALHRELNLLGEGEERQQALVTYASLLGTDLGDIGGALKALQGLFASAPSHTGGIQLLEGFVSAVTDPAAREPAVQSLVNAYQAAQRWSDLVALQTNQVEHTTDTGKRLELFKGLAAVKAEKLDDPAGAYADLEIAFREQPLDSSLRVELERMADASGAWGKLADAYNAALSVIPDATAQRPIRRKLAEVLDKKLGRGAEAVEHYKAASGGEIPDDLPSLEAMEPLLRQQNNIADLVEVLAAMSRHVSDPKRKKALLLEVGTISVEQLDDKARAIDTYKELAPIDEKDPEPHRRLARLYEELGQHEELEATLKKLVDFAHLNKELLDDYAKLANTQLELGRLTDAFASFRGILLKKREHPGAIAGLEALLERADNKLEIAQVLEPIFTAKQNHERLAWVLEKRLDVTEDKVQRKGLLRRIGDIYENRVGQKDRAFAMARRSLNEDPADMGVRMWIEKLANETGAMRELADAYVEEAQKADAPLNLQFHRRAAAIFQEKVNDGPSAVGQYRAILEIEEKDEKSLTGLESIFRATEDFTGLVEILQRRLEATAGVERKREYLAEIANIQAEKLGELEAAVQTNRAILEITPDDPAVFGRIEYLLAENGHWEELARTYEAEEMRLGEKMGPEVAARRLEYTHRRGRVLDQHFGDRASAADIFHAILTEQPQHPSTVEYLAARAQEGILEFIVILETVYLQAQQWQKYVELLEVKLTFTAETAHRRDIYVRLAGTYQEHLNAADMAFQAITRGYNENRADLELLASLEAMAAQYNAWEALVQVLGVDLDAIPDPELRQTLLRKLGDICGMKLNDVNRAVAYLNYALQYQPGDQLTLGALDQILEKSEMWQALAEVIERRVHVVDEPSEKSQLLERLANVWNDKLADPEAALRCHQQIMEIDPDHPISLLQMQKLYAEVEDWDNLAKNLVRQAQVFEEDEEQVRIHAAAGQLYTEEVGDFPTAIEHWQKVVALAPAHDEGNRSLTALLTSEERWEELAAHLQNELKHTQDPDAKLEINQRLGQVLVQHLGRGDDAIGYWAEVLEGQPKNADAMRALLPLYSERAEWTLFVDVAKRLVPLADPPEAKRVRFELAKALGENLGQRDEAIKLAREVRAQEPHTPEGLIALGDMLVNIEAFGEAVIAIEKAAALTEEVEPKVALWYRAANIHIDDLESPNDARTAYEAIMTARPDDRTGFLAVADIYRNTEEWRRLVGLDEDFIPHADDELRLFILKEIRDIQDQKLGEKELAFIAACRVYKEDPTDLESTGVLERIALETESAEEAAAVLEDELDGLKDKGVKIATLKQIARLYADELDDLGEAEAMLQKILEIDPGELGAIDQLANLGAKEERFDKQIAALESKLPHVQEDVERKSILFDIARIWEDRVGETDEAIGALNRLLAIDGADIPALDSLVRIYEGEAAWSELAHVLTRKVEICQDPAENMDLRMRVAQLCEGELGDQEAAIMWYRGVLEFDPGHAGALAALDRLYTGLERWSELIQVFELQIAQAQMAEQQLSLLSKMASVYESEFSSPADGAQCYERCFAIDQTHLNTVKNLERLLRVLGEWNRLIEILGHHITLIQDVDETTNLYLQIGEIYYKELTRVDKAEQIYTMARELNPNSDAALHALGQLYERSGNWFQGLEMMQREADAMGPAPEALPVLMRIGRINEDMLGDVGASQAAYQRALEVDPTYGPALEAMKEIAKNNQNWDAFQEHLLTLAETCDDNDDKTDFFVEAAEFFINIREDEMGAIRYYQRALEYSPDHLETCRALAEIYFRNEMWEEAGEMYEVAVKALDKSKDAKEYCQKHYRLGYVGEKMGEKESALEHYRQAFEADATYLPALEGLGQALLSVEQWDEAQKVFQTILIHHRDSLTESEIVDVQSQLGEIYLRENQPDRAYQQFEKALEIDPDHPMSLSNLARLDQVMQRWESAYRRLSRLGEVAPGPERIEALLTMSQIATDHIGSIAEAIEPLERCRRAGQAGPEILDRLADLYLRANQPQKAVDALDDAAQKAEDPQVKSDLSYRLGEVYEIEIKHQPLAVQKYNAALDAAPTNIKAFEAIERILGSAGEWALLESNYRAMIARSKVLSPKIRLVLWRALAELYRNVLKNIDSAIAAYEVIGKLEPGKPEDQMILAELYAHKPDKRAEAITLQHDLIPTIDNPVMPVKALRKLYHAAQDFDAVYIMCMALAFMKSADEEEMKVLEYLARGVPPRASGGLREEQWGFVKHADLECSIGQTATQLFKLGRDMFVRQAKDLGLKKKDHLDIRSSDLLFVNLVKYAGKILNAPVVDLYAKSGSMEGIHLTNCSPPALVVGQNNELYRDPSQTRLAMFHLGRSLAYTRPELFLARMFPGEYFRDLLLGICVAFNRQLQHSGHPTAVENWANTFSRMPQQALRRLQPLVEQTFKDIMAVRPLEKYCAAVEHTVNAAGMVVAGDLNAAYRGISEGDEGASAIAPRDRIKQLVLYMVSREHLQVRRAIGAALVSQQGGHG